MDVLTRRVDRHDPKGFEYADVVRGQVWGRVGAEWEEGGKMGLSTGVDLMRGGFGGDVVIMEDESDEMYHSILEPPKSDRRAA
jgi:hypothetical protein